MFGICFCIRQLNVRIIIVVVVVYGRPVNEKKTIEIDFYSVLFYNREYTGIANKQSKRNHFVCECKNTQFPFENYMWILCVCVRMCWFGCLFRSVRKNRQTNGRNTLAYMAWISMQYQTSKCVRAFVFVRVHKNRPKSRSKIKKINNQFGFVLNSFKYVKCVETSSPWSTNQMHALHVKLK